MSVKKAETFLVTIQPNQVDSWLEQLLASGVNFEALPPTDLGGQWQEAQPLSAPRVNRAGELELLASVLEAYKPKSFLSGLTDHRSPGTFEDIQQAGREKEELLQIAAWLKEYQELTTVEQRFLALQKDLKTTNLIIGENLTGFGQELNKFIGQVVSDFNQRHPDKPEVKFEEPKIEQKTLDRYVVIAYQAQDSQVIQDFLTEGSWGGRAFGIKEFQEFVSNRKKEIKEQLEAQGYTPVKLGPQKFKKLAACHALLQLEESLSQAKSKIFKVEEEAKLYFMFLAVSPRHSAKLEKFLKGSGVVHDKVDWKEEIVEWRQSGDLDSFRTIPQALGTIGSSESDPTFVTAILFSIFFAFCLGDAFYGLLIALICGGLLFFTRVKPGLKNMLTIFFWSGVATVVYGALTKTRAGDLFEGTPLSQPLSAVQILDPLTLNPESGAPAINRILIEAGNLHPTVALLGLCLLIGLVTVFIGYLLKLNTAIQSKEWGNLFSLLAWLGFLGSLFTWIGANAAGAAWSQVALVALVVFSLSLFIFNSGKGVIGKIVGGLGSLYGLISFGSDILSFTRLVAVGLTSGIIASVINLLTFLVFDGINVPVLNVVIAGVMLVVGHLFNLVIALFGAYINPLRLNYVEFYPKFFEGKGRQIKTLQTDFSYLRIQSN